MEALVIGIMMDLVFFARFLYIKKHFYKTKGVANGNGYKYADNTRHQKNYGDYAQVQTHVEPFYWIVDKAQKAAGASDSDSETAKKECLTYYVLEISWTETGKETDIFYVLAQNEG